MIQKIFAGSLFVFLLFPRFVAAQEYQPFIQIKKYTAQQAPSKYDSSLNMLTNRLGAELHYLYPLYQAINWEQKFKVKTNEAVYYDAFAEALSFAGDYNMATVYSEKGFAPLPDSVQKDISKAVNSLTGIQYLSAHKSIVDVAGHYETIMINEDHAKPQHRAFTRSILSDLYKAGFRYLATEAFNNYSNKCLDSLNVFTGYYTCEPVMGELVRHALQLGYKLISYEDTSALLHTNPSLRDSIQAANIYNQVKNDPTVKIVVHAGYAHISKEKIGDYIPMAIWYSKISGKAPFSIDQTEMTEGSHHEFGRLFYQYFTRRFIITEPSFLYQNKRPFNPTQLQGYDAIVYHPAVKNINSRPDWLTFNNERQSVLIAPSERNLFLVQAYYKEEYSKEALNYIVPADQTYIPAPSGYYGLFLRKGDYKIVLRDAGYKILSEKELVVK